MWYFIFEQCKNCFRNDHIRKAYIIMSPCMYLFQHRRALFISLRVFLWVIAQWDLASSVDSGQCCLLKYCERVNCQPHWSIAHIQPQSLVYQCFDDDMMSVMPLWMEDGNCEHSVKQSREELTCWDHSAYHYPLNGNCSIFKRAHTQPDVVDLRLNLQAHIALWKLFPCTLLHYGSFEQ